jgi:UDP-2,3-diacylglucosamine pyrophosphatase LpxH
MGHTTRAVILSDIHLGPGNDFSTFRDDRALAAFLDHLAAPAEPRTELILAGDCFDFLQIDGYAGFDATKAAERLEILLGSKRTAPVIAALRRFAARPGSEITLLAGNHDPEMLVPEVRACFAAAIDREGSVLHADDTPLRLAEGQRPAVWGRALGDDAHPVWVVHGDRWDPANMIDRDAVRGAVHRGQPVALPVGSHLVFEVLQKIKVDPRRRWVDELKPEGGVFLLLLYLDFATTSAFLWKHYRIGGDLISAMTRAALRRGPLFGPGEEPPAELDTQGLLAALLADDLRGRGAVEQETLLTQLDAAFEGEAPSAAGTLAAHGGVPRMLLRAWLAWMRHADRFQDRAGPDSIPVAAARYLPEGLAAFIAGHTHGPRSRPDLQPAYFNTGTWIPVGAIPPGDLRERIDQLDEGPAWATDSPRSFVVVDLQGASPQIRLGHCDADGTPRELVADA